MKKKYNPNSSINSVKEPEAAYQKTGKKTIRFFSSFEDENEYTAKQRAELSYDDRMIYAEELRRVVFNRFLLPDGSWMPIAKILTMKEPRA